MAKERDRVIFLRQDAERIARVVRAVENGRRDETPLRFGRVFEQRDPKAFRIATFSGSWNIGATKTVTFKYQTTTPNTASVTNLFFPITGTVIRDCAIAKDGAAWYLIDVPFHTATAVFARATASQNVVTSVTTAQQTVLTSITMGNFAALSSISIAANLNTSNCTITISQTANTQSVSYVSTASASTLNYLQTATTATITLLTSTFTAAFVRLEP